MKIEDLQDVVKINRELNHLKDIQSNLSREVLLKEFQVSCSQLVEEYIQITDKDRQRAILDVLRTEINEQVTNTESALNCLL